jgi:NAD-dependent SIR2 family protein deacetylase
MNSDASELGRCPECGEQIPKAWLLIKYQTSDDKTRFWAECPACEAVVNPE